MLDNLSETARQILILIPLSFFGLWRWSIWLSRKIGGTFYKPIKSAWPAHVPEPKVSVVVPVYNEDPEIFNLAVRSWIRNKPYELIVVIDHSNHHHIIDFQREFAKHPTVKCRVVVTKKPGKRPALADGIELAKGDLVALVDSDTIWAHNVKERILPYFLNKQVGGVSAQQRVYKPKSLAQVLFDIILWTRYNEELPFLLGTGQVINTLSGRTAFYRREALMNEKHNNMHHLTHEFYFKSRSISGDDKRLTHLIVEQGWLASYAKNAIVFTPGMLDMKTFLKQRLRWTRNSWRADTRAFKRRWILRHPALAFYNLDRFLQPFFMLIGPIIFISALIHEQWATAGILAIWWCLSRILRLFGYFRRHPKRLVYLPAYIVFSYYNALMKIYAWATLLEQGWITRWDKKRMARKKRKNLVVGLSVTLVVVIAMVLFVNTLHVDLGNVVSSDQDTVSTSELGTQTVALPAMPKAEPALRQDADTSDDLASYTVQQGDTLTSISAQTHVPVLELARTNNITSKNLLEPGDVIYYFPR